MMDPFSSHYSDDIKKNTFNNGSDKRDVLEMLRVNRP